MIVTILISDVHLPETTSDVELGKEHKRSFFGEL